MFKLVQYDARTVGKCAVSNQMKYLLVLIAIADSFHVYHDGIRRRESYLIEILDPEPLGYAEIVFGRVHVNLDENYCNCAVDEVQIFEVELKEDEVKLLYESV